MLFHWIKKNHQEELSGDWDDVLASIQYPPSNTLYFPLLRKIKEDNGIEIKLNICVVESGSESVELIVSEYHGNSSLSHRISLVFEDLKINQGLTQKMLMAINAIEERIMSLGPFEEIAEEVLGEKFYNVQLM